VNKVSFFDDPETASVNNESLTIDSHDDTSITIYHSPTMDVQDTLDDREYHICSDIRPTSNMVKSNMSYIDLPSDESFIEA